MAVVSQVPLVVGTAPVVTASSVSNFLSMISVSKAAGAGSSVEAYAFVISTFSTNGPAVVVSS